MFQSSSSFILSNLSPVFYLFISAAELNANPKSPCFAYTDHPEWTKLKYFKYQKKGH